jgi:hypothetical protein
MSDVSGKPVSDDARLEVFNLWEAGKLSGSDVAGSPELKEIMRDLSKKSLFFFAKAVLGYDRLTKLSHLHICQRTQDMTQLRQLVLMPRGTYKTTIRTKAFPLWYLLYNPDGTILIANQTSDNAESFVIEMEQHLEGRNPMLCWLFPEYIKPGDRFKPWSSDRFTVPCRQRISGAPSVRAVGCGTRVESWHGDVIIPDDLVGTEAMKSEPEMLSAELWHDGLESLYIEPHTGISRMSGTRYGMKDIYSKILRDNRYECITIEAINPETGEPNFPDILPLKTLEGIKQTNYMYYRLWYMNDARNPEILDFKVSDLKRYQLVEGNMHIPMCEIPGVKKVAVTDMDVVISVDPAGSGDAIASRMDIVRKVKAVKSNNAITIWGRDGDGDNFGLDMWAGRFAGDNPELQLCRKLLDFCRRWKGLFRTVYLESFGAQGAIMTIFKMLCNDVGESYPITLIPRGIQTAKLVRIRGNLGGPAQNGKVYIRAGHVQFEEEYASFPESPTLDLLDASSWALELLKQPMSGREEAYHEEQVERYHEDRMRALGVCGY